MTQKTLSEFIQSHLANNPTDKPEQVLTTVQAKTHPVWRKINANEARQFFGSWGALNKLEMAQTDLTEVETQSAESRPDNEAVKSTISELTKVLLSTLPNPGNTITTDPNTISGSENRKIAALLVTHKVFRQRTVDAFFAQAQSVVNTYPNATLTDVKKVMYPPTEKQTVYTAGAEHLVSASARTDKFTFIVDTNAETKPIKLRFRWRTDASADWVNALATLTIPACGVGLNSITFNRPQGIPAARLFQFFYTEEYAGQINSISVELG